MHASSTGAKASPHGLQHWEALARLLAVSADSSLVTLADQPLLRPFVLYSIARCGWWARLVSTASIGHLQEEVRDIGLGNARVGHFNLFELARAVIALGENVGSGLARCRPTTEQ